MKPKHVHVQILKFWRKVDGKPGPEETGVRITKYYGGDTGIFPKKKPIELDLDLDGKPIEGELFSLYPVEEHKDLGRLMHSLKK